MVARETPKQKSPPNPLVEIIDRAWPLIILRMPEALDEAAVQSMFKGLDRVLERQAQFSMVVDTRALKSFPTPVERKTLAKWMTERTLAEARYNLGNAVVMASPLARAAFAAIQWVRRPVTAHFMTASTVAGIDWCSERLRAASIVVPVAVAAVRLAEEVRDRNG
jgi:hypothetical protein